MVDKPGSQFPAPIYRDTVLTQVFADAKRLFLPSMIEIDYAHLLMLAEQKIVSHETATACFHALDALDLDAIRATKYDGSVEDLFFLVENKLAELCGAENAGRIHTARSRNDIDMTMYRMVLRARLLSVIEALVALRKQLLAIASKHRAALMPAYTHNQPAQPTTMGHYLMAMIEVLERDTERVRAAYVRVNRSPLGACAITTTGFPINRERTAELLGFDSLQVNSYGAIASVDYLTESCAVLATAMVNLGRFTQEMLLWSTAEFGFLRLSDAYVQISSIMPQKRNPVPLEHVRILASRAMSEAQAVLNSLHNTPFADMNDSEDSLQPLVDLAFTDGLRALTLLEGILSEATFNTDRMAARAQSDYLPVTELADTLARDGGISFHQAHSVVSAAVRATNGMFDRERMISLISASLQEQGITPLPAKAMQTALDAENFVAVRSIIGGPAASALNPEIARAEKQSTQDAAWCQEQKTRLEEAHKKLRAAVKALAA